MQSTEINFKKDFCQRYFDRDSWQLDVLNQVDVLLLDPKGEPLLYIEAKYLISADAQRRAALAQTILTNRKQQQMLARVALVYQDPEGHDVLELLDCSDNSVLYNNDINWAREKPSAPTRDAIDRICDRLEGRITIYRDDEIRQLYLLLKRGQDTVIQITTSNFNLVYNQWRHAIRFRETIADEQDLINLFLVDMLKGTRYRQSVYHGLADQSLFASLKAEADPDGPTEDLIREGTNLSQYRIMYEDGQADGIKYSPASSAPSSYYTIADRAAYALFWRKYHRPPEKQQFLAILERSATLYSDQYRRDTGGEYTPSCFVELQNERLAQFYNMDDYIVFDPCAGVGNLENQFGRDYKPYCYLSTLEQMDVDTCRIKGFENSIQFDYLASSTAQPRFKYGGQPLDINEICRREGRKLMVIMNPPYQRRKGFKYDLCIEFFLKVLQLKPSVIVYYCKTEFLLRDTVSVFSSSTYRIRSHAFSNAKDTFQLSEWSVSQIIFDSSEGTPIDPLHITASRYDYDKPTDSLHYIKDYTYDNSRPCLINELEHQITSHMDGLVLGQWSYLNKVLIVSNGGKEKKAKITTGNLYWCLVSKGINFNTHNRYYEWNYLTYRGTVESIPNDLCIDAIMFSLFYKGNLFSNCSYRNFIMPFTAAELGCDRNDLNVLFPEDSTATLFHQSTQQPPFDFRQWFHQHSFSPEALSLYAAALELFRYYHHSGDYPHHDYNDSFYDITNAFMGKDPSQFSTLDTDHDTRIARTRTTKGTRGFGRTTIRYAVPSSALPIFTRFFDARDTLALKINRRLLEEGLLLWQRENIY